jgi:hypothetical protein
MKGISLNTARVLIGFVILMNLQAAAAFLLRPEQYAPSFELENMVGEAILRGMGVLFVMWNVPYVVALWNPIRHRISLYESLAMQTIGLVGETIIFFSLPMTNHMLKGSIQRFMAFDGLGLALLIAAAWVTRGPSGGGTNSNKPVMH